MFRALLAMAILCLSVQGQTQKDTIIRFTHLIGDQKKAEKLASDLDALAGTNGLRLEMVIEAASKMLDLNVKPESIPKFLLVCADTASGTQTDTFRQTRTFLVFAESLPQIADAKTGKDAIKHLYALDYAGIPAFKIYAESLGVEESYMKELIARGGFIASDCVESILAHCMEKYKGLAKKLADSRK